MCYAYPGQMRQAEAAGASTLIGGSGAGSGPFPNTILCGAQDAQQTELTGLASCYDLKGWQRADLNPFDSDARSGAMFGKGTFGKSVNVDSIITTK